MDIAARGQGKLTDAKARYAEAISLDANRPELDRRSSDDPATAKAAFKKAADAFRRVGTERPDAKRLADDCDKAAALL